MDKLKDINWNHLYCFYEVAKAQSLKKAVQIIGTTPSTLSEQIKKLETSFDKKFFHRTPKGLKLTTDGLVLYECTKNIFKEGSKLLEKYTDDIIGGYPVTVGIEDTITSDLASEFTSQYWDLFTQYGTVNTTRQAGHDTLIDNLVHGNLDWGISMKIPRKKNMDYAEIGAFEIIFCCSEELYNKFKDKKDILINIPMAQSAHDQILNKAITNYLKAHSITPREVITSDHPEYMKKLCQRGRLVMFQPKNPLSTYDGLKVIELENQLKVSLYAIWKKEDEKLVSIMKLKELLSDQLSNTPHRYEDVDLQIEVSEISDELLN